MLFDQPDLSDQEKQRARAGKYKGAWRDSRRRQIFTVIGLRDSYEMGLLGDGAVYVEIGKPEDDDHYYLGGVLAEKLRLEGCEVSLVTPAAEASAWTRNTLEQERIQSRLLHLGVEIRPHRELVALHGAGVELACVFTQRRESVAGDAGVRVTER